MARMLMRTTTAIPTEISRTAQPESNLQSLPDYLERESRRPSSYADSRGGLGLYLAEIGKVKLLTAEEEIELAARVQAGDKEAREQMIKANLRLVVKFAREYDGLGLPLMDLISEGNIGLMKAVERYDPARGAKLSTYASWWIKQSMMRALADQSKTIRIPTHMVEKIRGMNRVARELTLLLGRDPSDEELAGELGTTELRVAQMRAANNRALSLDAAVGEEDSITLGELVEDDNAERPSEELEFKTRVRMLRDMVAKLSPREAEVIRSRFGLDGTGPKMLDEIGNALGITRERVRQIQQKALTKLRKMMRRSGMPLADDILMLAA
jgi:RNA polymerase primary sigma factor